MKTSTMLLFYLSTAGISLSLFFSILLFKHDKKNPFSNQILSLLLLCLSLRIGKSVFYNFIELPLFVKNIGLAFNLAIGPLLFIYGLSLTKSNFSIRTRHLNHFIPTFFFILFCWIIPNGRDHQIFNLIYLSILFQSFAYVFLCIRLWQIETFDHSKTSRWYISLTIGLAMMWVVYLAIFVNLIPIYLAGAISFTALMFLLSYLGFQNKEVFHRTFSAKYQSSSLDKAAGQKILSNLKSKINEEKLYLDPMLSLDSLAQVMEVHPRTLSQSINQNSNGNFSALINNYRIAHAKKLFSSKHYKNEKILTIAFESGYKNLSTFNAAFKQLTSTTPSEYRSQFSNSQVVNKN